RMVITLCTNILGMILAIAGTSVGSEFWAKLERPTGCVNIYRPAFDYDCHCQHNNETIKYSVHCWRVDVVRVCTGIVTTIFGVFAILSFLASINSCIRIYNVSRGPTAVDIIAQQPNTLVLTTSQAHNEQPSPYSHPAGAGQYEMIF
ncbi:Hypothetical predicted protein, partial [Paramuricea clavata]